MRKSWTAVAILVIFSTACTRSSQPLTIHDPSKIQYVEVIHWSKEGGRGPLEEYTIEDRKRIEAIVALLKANNAHYRKNMALARSGFFGTEIPHEYTLHFEESVDTAAPLSVTFDADWLSGIDDQKDERGQTFFRTRPLSDSEWKDLVALIARRPDDRDRYGG